MPSMASIFSRPLSVALMVFFASSMSKSASGTRPTMTRANLVKYEQFECKTCGEKVKEGHKNYVGPTKAAVSLIYLF